MCMLDPGVCDIIVLSKYAMKPAGAGLLAVPGGVEGTPGCPRGSVSCGEAIEVSALKSRQGSLGSVTCGSVSLTLLCSLACVAQLSHMVRRATPIFPS